MSFILLCVTHDTLDCGAKGRNRAGLQFGHRMMCAEGTAEAVRAGVDCPGERTVKDTGWRGEQRRRRRPQSSAWRQKIVHRRCSRK